MGSGHSKASSFSVSSENLFSSKGSRENLIRQRSIGGEQTGEKDQQLWVGENKESKVVVQERIEKQKSEVENRINELKKSKFEQQESMRLAKGELSAFEAMIDKKYSIYRRHQPLIMEISWKMTRFVKISRTEFETMIRESNSFLTSASINLSQLNSYGSIFFQLLQTLKGIRMDAMNGIYHFCFMLQELLTHYVSIESVYQNEPTFMSIPTTLWMRMEEHANTIKQLFTVEHQAYAVLLGEHEDRLGKGMSDEEPERFFERKNNSINYSDAIKEELNKTLLGLIESKQILEQMIKQILEDSSSNYQYMKIAIKHLHNYVNTFRGYYLNAKDDYKELPSGFSEIGLLVSSDGVKKDIDHLKEELRKWSEEVKPLKPLMEWLNASSQKVSFSEGKQIFDELDSMIKVKEDLDTITLLLFQCNSLFSSSMFDMHIKKVSFDVVKAQIQRLNLTTLFENCGKETIAQAVLAKFIVENLLKVDKKLPELLNKIFRRNSSWIDPDSKIEEMGLNYSLEKYQRFLENAINHHKEQKNVILRYMDSIENQVKLKFNFSDDIAAEDENVKEIVREWSENDKKLKKINSRIKFYEDQIKELS